jgi:LysM repeat protein
MENKEIAKALAPIKTEITRVESYASALEIKTETQLKEATNELAIVKTIQKQLTEKKEGITKPLMTALKNVRAIFAPLEAKTTAAEQIIKSKMIRYQEIVAAKAQKKADKIAADVEAGKIGFDEGVAKQAKIAEPPKTVSTENGQITYRIVKKVVVEDPALLPREYLVPDFVKIRADALAGKQIAGVKIVEEKVVSART